MLRVPATGTFLVLIALGAAGCVGTTPQVAGDVDRCCISIDNSGPAENASEGASSGGVTSSMSPPSASSARASGATSRTATSSATGTSTAASSARPSSSSPAQAGSSGRASSVASASRAGSSAGTTSRPSTSSSTATVASSARSSSGTSRAPGSSGTATSGPACGNGILDPGEQCDDGNAYHLDGCDPSCRYEVVTRLSALSLETSAGASFCTPATNALGTRVFTTLVVNQLNQPLANAIGQGSANLVLQFLGLDDLAGVSDPDGLAFALMDASRDPAGGAWPGGNPVDTWLLADHASVGPDGLPITVVGPASLANRNLAAGPGDVDLSLSIFGTLRLRNTQLRARFDNTPAPDVPAPPPAVLAPGLTVFRTLKGSGPNQGLCGNITVESLSRVPVPDQLTTGQTQCAAGCTGSHAYTACGSGNPVGPGCNSLLDVMVGGCAVVVAPFGFCAPLVNPQQPDVPATPSGTITTLTLGAGNKVPAALSTGNDDAYSSSWKFDATRSHFTGETCGQPADCQAGLTCVGGSCR